MERADQKRSTVVALGLVLACCRCAFALNPSLDISQYAHQSWTIRDGFFKGTIFSIAQTPDGYLWLGTEFGLLRFDGVRSVPWQPPAGERLPNNSISSLLAARDGRLWIGTPEGLASWKDGKLAHYPELNGRRVGSLIQDREGTIWASESSVTTGRLCRIRGGDGRSTNVQCYGADGSFGSAVGRLYEDSAGSLWAPAASGFWRWKPGPPKLYPVPITISYLLEGDDGALWFSTTGGMKQLVDGRAQALRLPGDSQPFNPRNLLRDRDGGVWIGTRDQGLLHVHRGRTDHFIRADGLSGGSVSAFFEDREGNIWVATEEGLDRFRDFAIPTISAREGLSDDNVLSVLAARDGSVWVATLVGLDRLKDGQITIYRKHDGGLPDNNAEALLQDARGRIWVSTPGGIVFVENGRFNTMKLPPGGVVRAIAEDSEGKLWFSRDSGAFRLEDGSVVDEISWARLGREDHALSFVPDPARGGVWLGFSPGGGVVYFKDGRIHASYTAADGLGEGRVGGLRLDGDGTVWASTLGGLSRVKNGRVSTLTDKNGLPCNTVHWSMEDDEHSLWLYTACGVVRIARTELDAWAGDPKRNVHASVFDNSDGVRATANVVSGLSPRVAKSADGRLWFARPGGVSVIDPRHIPINKLPPPVHVEEVKVDGNPWDASHGWRLPALTRDLEIHYTALSLVAPEKNRFKYKLEGRDSDWKDAGNERKASYTDLPPRSYRFRVLASNNNGVWNEAGDSLDFSIAPAYYQTAWFRASCVGAFFVLLWALYRYRLRQVAQEFNVRLEERVGERTRIARELHDTLLQSFQASLFQMQAARNLFSRRPEKAVQTLDEAITMTEGAITEGRDAIQDLRSQPAVHSDLAQLLTATGQELARAPDAKGNAANGNPVIFRVAVEGERQDLDPIIQDEAYRIARELLRNAFRHAQAGQIEAEIRYEDRLFRVRIRDDGKGIEPEIVKAGGRGGHWGLLGMRERAKQIGAKLEFWSEAGAGTEVELSIPSSIAYGAARRGRFQLLTKKKANS